MFKIRYLYVLSFVFTLSSCWDNSPFSGYSQSASGLYYKLQVIGDGAIKPKEGDLLQLSITYKTLRDSVFMDSYSYNETGTVILPYRKSSFKGSFEEGLTSINVGDSVSYIVNADSLFGKFFNAEVPYFLKEDGLVKLEVKLYGILDKEDFLKEFERYKEIVEDLDINERRILNLYLDTNQVEYFPIWNGMYYLPIKQGVGPYAKSGDKVTINYKGYFLNGKKFESTYDRGEALEFRLGTQDQVIKGFQSAISLMNEGSKTKFIIPSHLAFGEFGSSTNIIPAYTTVIYEIELLSIKK